MSGTKLNHVKYISGHAPLSHKVYFIHTHMREVTAVGGHIDYRVLTKPSRLAQLALEAAAGEPDDSMVANWCDRGHKGATGILRLVQIFNLV